MNEIVAFFRAFPLRKDTLCSEPVAAWLRSRGVSVDMLRIDQRELWARGMIEGARDAARRVGAHEVAPEEAQPGDVALIAQDGAEPAMGMMFEGGFVAASFGRLIIVTEPVVVAAWRV